MKAAELLELSMKELKERIDAEKANLVKQKLNHSVSPLDNPMKIKEARRKVATMMTVLRQKELSETKKV
jgi:large subunit ribosomal protein L29